MLEKEELEKQTDVNLYTYSLFHIDLYYLNYILRYLMYLDNKNIYVIITLQF